jgi:predicted RecB family endonuclease
VYKVKVEITTDNGVLKAGKVLDVSKHLKPKEIKELECAGYIEKYNEDTKADEGNETIKELEAKVDELTIQINGLASTNEELNTLITSKDETIKELEAKVQELSKKTTTPKAGAKK